MKPVCFSEHPTPVASVIFSHISRGLNFRGVSRHFGLPFQSANLIGDFRRVAAIRLGKPAKRKAAR